MSFCRFRSGRKNRQNTKPESPGLILSTSSCTSTSQSSPSMNSCGLYPVANDERRPPRLVGMTSTCAMKSHSPFGWTSPDGASSLCLAAMHRKRMRPHRSRVASSASSAQQQCCERYARSERSKNTDTRSAAYSSTGFVGRKRDGKDYFLQRTSRISGPARDALTSKPTRPPAPLHAVVIWHLWFQG